MYEHNTDKSNAQKLAETLKRCGLASSVSQAHKMAVDIASTEKKVQVFFDQKKKEMKDTLMESVHGNREEFKNAKSKDVVSAQIENFRNENSKNTQPTESQTKPINVQTEFETKTITQNVHQISQEAIEPLKQEPVFESPVIQEESSVTNQISEPESIVEEQKTEVVSTGDYVTQFVNQFEEKSSEEATKVNTQAEKEEITKVDMPKENIESSPVEKPQAPQETSHKTGNPPGIDIHNFFNFQKKGKV